MYGQEAHKRMPIDRCKDSTCHNPTLGEWNWKGPPKEIIQTRLVRVKYVSEDLFISWNKKRPSKTTVCIVK